MKKKGFVVFFILLIACNKENIKEEYYSGGALKTRIYVDKNGIPNGSYNEFYSSGELKVKANYLNGVIKDTVFSYYKSGKIKERGLMSTNKLKTGWWFYYDSLGYLKNKNEYIIIDNSLYKNQTIYYDKNGRVKESESSFFTINLSDTIHIGKNAGELHYNSNFSGFYEKLLYVIIENEYENNEIKKDTFINTDNYTRFGIYAHKTGIKKVKGTILERGLFLTKTSKDSSMLEFKDHYKYFEKEVYVKDTIR